MLSLGADLRHQGFDLPDTLPDYSAQDIFDVEFDKLGNPHTLLDLDLTIRRAHATEIEAGIITFLSEQKEMGSIASLSLATNSDSDLSRFADQLGAKVFQPFDRGRDHISKPDVRFFDYILSELDIAAGAAVMIGDKCRHDIRGANRAGIRTVMVEPLGNDYWFDKILLTRYRDRRALHIAKRALGAAQEG